MGQNLFFCLVKKPAYIPFDPQIPAQIVAELLELNRGEVAEFGDVLRRERQQAVRPMTRVHFIVGQLNAGGRQIVLVIEIDRVAYLALRSKLVHYVVVDCGANEVELSWKV